MIKIVEAQFRKYFPKMLVSKLTYHYAKLKSSFIQNRLEPGELNGAKFAEVVFRLIQCATDPQQQYTPLKQPLPSVDTLVIQFQKLPNTFDNSLRLHIPRALKAIYGIRSKRGVGHTGEIDANLMDATLVMAVCDWVMAELIRLYHDCSAEEAQNIVDRLVKRSIPIIYDRDGIKTLLAQTSYDEAALLFLQYEGEEDVPIGDLCKWVGHPNVTNFRNQILRKLHIEKKIYLDEKARLCRILPPGMQYVEESVLPKIKP
jgi:hypothetical protein